MKKRIKHNFQHINQFLGCPPLPASWSCCSRWLFSLCLFSLTVPHIPAFAAPHEQSGQIEFSEQKEGSRVTATQQSVLEYWNTIQSTISKSETAPDISDNEISYLNATYYYCTINNGTCPVPLEALYEIDLSNSKIKGSSECPLLTRFWKSWMKNGFEDREKYSVKTAFIASTNTFNSQVRPRYIRCQDSIKADLTELGSNADKWRVRHSEGGSGFKSITQMKNLLQLINEKNIDVFGVPNAPHPQKKSDPSSNTNIEKNTTTKK